MENESTNAFTIMPMNQKISLNPGEVMRGTLQLLTLPMLLRTSLTKLKLLLIVLLTKNTPPTS